MDAIRLSVCIPTYNFGAYIGETLASVVSPATEEVEIVVVDGASTDNTEEVVRGFQSRFPAISYHRLEQKGGIDNDLARTVALARGDYCWLLSSDDVPVAGTIPRLLREIASGCDVYLFGRTVCDHGLKPLFDQQWLGTCGDERTFTFTQPGDFIDYCSRARSIGALFSYISSIVVKRERWNSSAPDGRFIGTNYAHAARLFTLLQRGGALRYIREPLVRCRGGNDSFAREGVARRFLIDLDGYLSLAEALFADADTRQAFLAVMRREHPWYVYADLRSRIGECGQWRDIKTRLLEFGYEPWQVAAAGALGSLGPVTTAARQTWFGIRRIRTSLARLARKRDGA